MDDEVQPHAGTWNNNKSGSSGYESQPQSDHSSLDKNSPPASKVCLRDGTLSDGKGVAPSWLSPIKEGVVDVHQYRIPRPVWPGHRNAAVAGRVLRPKCCRHCTRCRCRSDSSSSGCSISSADSGVRNGGKATAAIDGSGSGSYTAYSSSAYGGSVGGTISTSTTTSTSAGGASGDNTGSCSDDAAVPSSGTESVKSSNLQLQHSSPLTLDPSYGDGLSVNKTLVNNWNSVDLRLNQKTDNLHYVSTLYYSRSLKFGRNI